jgi:hypothetical protein
MNHRRGDYETQEAIMNAKVQAEYETQEAGMTLRVIEGLIWGVDKGV